VTVQKIRRDIYDRLPVLHRETVNLLVAVGKWVIIENESENGLNATVGPRRSASTLAPNRGNNHRGVSP